MIQIDQVGGPGENRISGARRPGASPDWPSGAADVYDRSEGSKQRISHALHSCFPPRLEGRVNPKAPLMCGHGNGLDPCGTRRCGDGMKRRTSDRDAMEAPGGDHVTGSGYLAGDIANSDVDKELASAINCRDA